MNAEIDFSAFPKDLGPVLAISVAEDEAWVGTMSGLARWTGAAWAVYTSEDGLPASEVNAVVHAGDTVWAGTSSGLARWEAGNWNVVDVSPVEQEPPFVWDLDVTKDGDVWAATDGAGALRIGSSSIERFTSQDGLPSERVFSVSTTDDGAVWFATEDAGVGMFVAGRWHSFSHADGLPSDMTYTVHGLSATNAVIGTSAGLAILDETGWSSCSSDDGLPHDVVTSLAVSPDGSLWTGTLAGVARAERGTTGCPQAIARNGFGASWAMAALDDGSVVLGLEDSRIARLPPT